MQCQWTFNGFVCFRCREIFCFHIFSVSMIFKICIFFFYCIILFLIISLSFGWWFGKCCGHVIATAAIGAAHCPMIIGRNLQNSNSSRWSLNFFYSNIFGFIHRFVNRNVKQVFTHANSIIYRECHSICGWGSGILVGLYVFEVVL